MSNRFRVACIQTNSAREIADNLAPVADLVRRARDDGADLILMPENVSMIEPVPHLAQAKAETEDAHPALAAFRALAIETGAWLLIGSLAIRGDSGKIANRSFLIDQAGGIVARYDKIHLFDVDLGNGESYRESATLEPGREPVMAETPWGRLGLSICYDLRFPRLYRHLAKSGADYLAVPAAFTETTGRAHWHVLIRARAIENGAFVFAPAQCGTHAEGRRTYGHSLIVNPWGEVLADGGDAVGFVAADIDPTEAADARRRIPALQHEQVIG
jgi:predicted amidohydrolase